MCAQKNLLSLINLHQREDLRQVANDLRVKRELGFFEDKRTRGLHQVGPQETNETKRTVREVGLCLPPATRLESGAQMGPSAPIVFHLQPVDLRYYRV